MDNKGDEPTNQELNEEKSSIEVDEFILVEMWRAKVEVPCHD